ncbi:MAG: hypothetical protein FP814_08840 [Desulfobacterium sp.]|nr:hypothetical protein [Desulfobacteraceae bacterium]MBA3036584.1 hypothetical protein [Desulfobacterium sp.]MBU4053218.1 hypothetical protein [Pseudomonadota bacterium]
MNRKDIKKQPRTDWKRIDAMTVARDLIKETMELREDTALAEFAENRESGFDPAKALAHDDAWS